MSSPIPNLKAYLSNVFTSIGTRSFRFRRRMVMLKSRVIMGVYLTISVLTILLITLLMGFPKPSPESTSHALAKLEDYWVAESGHITKDYKKLLHLSQLQLNIRSLSNNRMIIYAKPASEILPPSIILKLQQAENLTEGRVFRAISQSDSINFNMILSRHYNKLTLAFAIEDGPANGEYVFSFLRHEGSNSDLSSF
ncbi:hypothetical protein [Catalinimonas niigatensis]|uniref:hypothetical protein n=1 Tax=Catalinimonas niigatensis TaxID=1397264 RepID=UPI002666AFB7|nr:hypothetical protein [Catalinimonas niigatensis]WPP48579.1 hypothetical protein PZB72_18065 [Catalinimonas niigatensis]